ncbi:MAG: hypothetical protein JSV22_03995 [Bacteroidales bacterium]|nr:MAG: hypothetical protein JSV22_03995 [Bacteroidales bacterium]
MKKLVYRLVALLYMILLLVISNINSFTQTYARIENTNLEVDEGRLIISYDLINTRPNERFDVWVDISNASGQAIRTKNISGHIGKNIVGGKGLNIIWNFESEGIDFEGNINVQVMAELVTVHNLKVERILIKSAVFPGWGLHDIEKINPYLLIGVAGYGSVAAALIFNSKSNVTYDKYLSSDDIVERETLYSDFNKQENTTKIFGYSAAAIWILDIGWATIKYLNKTGKVNADVNPRFRIGYDFYKYGNTPLLTFKYNF